MVTLVNIPGVKLHAIKSTFGGRCTRDVEELTKRAEINACAKINTDIAGIEQSTHANINKGYSFRLCKNEIGR